MQLPLNADIAATGSVASACFRGEIIVFGGESDKDYMYRFS